MSESNKIKAVLVELTQNDHTETVDGVKTVKRGETLKYWYANDNYPAETIDPGAFWTEGDGSILHPATPDGVMVLDDVYTLSKRLQLRFIDIKEALALDPGQWVERTYDDWNATGCRVRMTAFAELPPLSAERTITASDLSNRVRTRIRVNGKPLYAPGTMENGERVWLPELYDFVVDAVVAAVRAKGGPTADVSLHDVGSITAKRKCTVIRFDLKAKSREGLVEFLRNLGVPNPEMVKVSKTTGDANGVSCVYATLTCSDFVND